MIKDSKYNRSTDAGRAPASPIKGATPGHEQLSQISEGESRRSDSLSRGGKGKDAKGSRAAGLRSVSRRASGRDDG